MILQRLTFFTLSIVLATLFPLEHDGLRAKPYKIHAVQSLHPLITLAKNTTKTKRLSSPVLVNNVRYHDHKKYTRIVLDLPTRVTVKELQKNNLVKIVLATSRLSKRAVQIIQGRQFPRSISIKEGATGTVIVTLDLAALNKYELKTLQGPNRVVIDLFYPENKSVLTSKNKVASAKRLQKTNKKKNIFKPLVKTKATKHSKKTKSTKGTIAKVKPKRSLSQKNTVASQRPSKSTDLSSRAKKKKSESKAPTSRATAISENKYVKKLVVVIDPGHGGKDPGAIGKKGTKEKHITLKIGNYLKHLIQKRLGSKVLLTRKKDVFLDLEKRVQFANKNKADLFISIHVNSHPQKAIKGLEVYHFGKASDPRALEVAARENGMTLENGAPPWQFIIADKLSDQKIEQSQTLAWITNKTLIKTLKSSYKVKDHGVKTAPFYVLRFTTMPSILAEVAFISNSDEEKRLRSKTFQRKLAEGMYKSIHSYIKTTFSNPS